MGTELARIGGGPLEFTPEQRKIILDTFANGAQEHEFAALMAVAQARGLNPILKQIYFVKRWDSQRRKEVWATQVSIDGLRAIADRTSKYAGQDEPEFIETDKGLVCCKVRVYRKDWERPAVGVAYFQEYVQVTKEGQPTQFWRKMPHIMLAKCAEALALRKAFPEDTSGLYTPEEMSQADSYDASGESPRQAPVRQVKSSDLVGDEPVPAGVLEALAEIGCAEGAVTVEQAAAIYSDHLDHLKTEELAAAAVYLKRRAGVSMAAWSRAVEEANALRGKALTPPREREPGEDDDQPAPSSTPEHPAFVAFREKIDSASTLEAVAQAWVCHSEAFKDTPMAPAAWSDAVAAAGTALKESDKAKASEALRLEVKRLKTPPTDPTPNGSEPRRTRKAKADGQAVAQTVQQTPSPEASLSSSEKAQLQNWRNHLARKESVFAVQGSYRKHRHELAGVSKLLGALAFEAACARYVMILRPDNARPDTLAHLEARARSFIATGTEDLYATPANYTRAA